MFLEVDVGNKKILMVGLCLGDPSIYPADSTPVLGPKGWLEEGAG